MVILFTYLRKNNYVKKTILGEVELKYFDKLKSKNQKYFKEKVTLQHIYY